MPLLICFLYHNILSINTREDDKLDTGQTVLVKRLLIAILSPLFCVHDCEVPDLIFVFDIKVFDIKGEEDKLLLASLNAFLISSCFHLQHLKWLFCQQSGSAEARVNVSAASFSCLFSTLLFLQLPFQLLFNLFWMYNERTVCVSSCEHFGDQAKAPWVFVQH